MQLGNCQGPAAGTDHAHKHKCLPLKQEHHAVSGTLYNLHTITAIVLLKSDME